MQNLVGVGYSPVQQTFPFSYFQVVTPPTFIVDGTALPSNVFGNLNYGGSGSVSGRLLLAGVGCSDADYAHFEANQVALVYDSSDCKSSDRIQMALRHNAAALVIALTGPVFLGTNPTGPMATIPVLRVSVLFGQALGAGSNNTQCSIVTNNKVTLVYSSNVIADTPGGDPNNVVVIGAHLDSVAAGPGINDNGSGSAVVLTIAMEMARLQLTPVNKVRFIFFGGEERGLLGSTYYVSSLKGDQPYQIAMMLNFDMMGSPNYFMGVYNGTQYSPAAGVIQKAFERYADAQSIFHQPTPFTGRSDYGPFLPICPAGGLFTGAEEIKSMSEEVSYGGLPRASYDPCYHQACDTIDNISWEAIGQSSKLAAYAVQYFAFMSNLRSTLGSTV